LALLGIGLYDFFIIHIFTLAVGHYNHSNISISGRVTGLIVSLMIAILILTQSFDIRLTQINLLWEQIALVIALGAFGYLILGPIMKILFNHPEMHIWHHAYEIPEQRKYGVNFGLSLAIWDFMFKTAYIPHDGKDIKLGFPGVESFPENFSKQITHGFKSKPPHLT